MRRFFRFLLYCLLTLLVVVAVCAGLFGYFVYSPPPAVPQFSGSLTENSLMVDGLKRRYRTYVPRKLAPGAPLVLVMHGSGQTGAEIRVETGYAFDRLADEHGFVVVYPDSYSFDWNDCSKVGDFSVKGRLVDDLGFLRVLADKLVADNGLDPKRVFATGVSAGGFMSLRLALEAPAQFRAVAAVAANLPQPDNFKCKPVGPGTSVMIMNGTKDPLVPFEGGEVNLLGLFFKGGKVHSSGQSAQYFADLNKLAVAPATVQAPTLAGAGVEQLLWQERGKAEVELVAIRGGGHGLPQPWFRRARLLGPSPMAPNGAATIWAFFARQGAR